MKENASDLEREKLNSFVKRGVVVVWWGQILETGCWWSLHNWYKLCHFNFSARRYQILTFSFHTFSICHNICFLCTFLYFCLMAVDHFQDAHKAQVIQLICFAANWKEVRKKWVQFCISKLSSEKNTIFIFCFIQGWIWKSN